MDLVEVCFTTENASVFVQPGTTLLGAADLAGVDIVAGCTRGMCGTDAVRVRLDDHAALEAPSNQETGTLLSMGLGDDCRLACQARVRTGRIEVLGDALA